jgi:hypothetical protein
MNLIVITENYSDYLLQHSIIKLENVGNTPCEFLCSFSKGEHDLILELDNIDEVGEVSYKKKLLLAAHQIGMLKIKLGPYANPLNTCILEDLSDSAKIIKITRLQQQFYLFKTPPQSFEKLLQKFGNYLGVFPYLYSMTAIPYTKGFRLREGVLDKQELYRIKENTKFLFQKLLNKEEVEEIYKPKEKHVTRFKVDDIVEIKNKMFYKKMAKIVSINLQKEKAELLLLNAPILIPVTISLNDLILVSTK